MVLDKLIKISKKTKKNLIKLKIHHKESFEEVISRILDKIDDIKSKNKKEK